MSPFIQTLILIMAILFATVATVLALFNFFKLEKLENDVKNSLKN